MIAVMAISAGVPLAGALGITNAMGLSWPALFVYAAIVLPVYGALMYKFRTSIGIERFFRSRAKKK